MTQDIKQIATEAKLRNTRIIKDSNLIVINEIPLPENIFQVILLHGGLQTNFPNRTKQNIRSILKLFWEKNGLENPKIKSLKKTTTADNFMDNLYSHFLSNLDYDLYEYCQKEASQYVLALYRRARENENQKK